MADLTHAEQQAIKPYGSGPMASSGYSGSDTSEQRARRDDSDGTTAKRQREVLDYLALRGEAGGTWKGLALMHNYHHGQASGALSNLHKVGLICRLAETRDRCKVYVLPEHVNGREVEGHGRPKPVLTTDEQAQIIGAQRVLDLGSGAAVPGWRVKQLLAIIDRLT